ncbi:MobF family relaxase [Pseudoalteromonas undina]|uniref:MobF family relaxase n=1 Tax=Pseudoalteromonas undina TaxID=43660 RepID=UPI0006BAFA7E|nr:MobF family relaxase [Pseudoalteromonas undina]
MLTVSPIRNVKYYSELAKEDYYLDGGEPNGVWAGKARKLLDLSGEVETEEYINIMHGYSPCKKYELCQNSGANRRFGWDLTFSSPKSVSVAWARADLSLKADIQKAHFGAVKSALSFLENNAAVTRRNKSGQIREKVTGLIAATFEHATSRAQDPQLHTHCLIANAAPRVDGSWGTLDSRELYLWHKAAGTFYRAELAAQLKELGFEITKDGEMFKLPLVPEKICEYYSKRGAMIKEELVKYGNAKSCSKAGDIASLSTRVIKEAVNRKELYTSWCAELDNLNFTENHLLSHLSKVHSHDHWLNEIAKSQELLTLNVLEDKVSQSNSTFRLQDIYKAAAEIAQTTGDGGEGVNNIVSKFIKLDDCISLGIDHKNNSIYTTQAIIDNEQAMISGAKKLRNFRHFEVEPIVIENAISAKSFPLTEEQKEAVLSACQNNAFDIIQGSAGAGKSALMDCVSKAYKNSNYNVIGCAIAKSAANNLAAEANIETFTIAKLLKNNSLTQNSVLIVDEAGQVSSKDLRKLIDLTKETNSKLILVGEDKQLDAIEHGGSLKYLSQPEVLGTTRVETIKRQREPWARQVVADFRDGKAEAALNSLNEKGLLHFADDSEQTKTLLVEKWNKYRLNNPNKQSIVLAQRWSDVNQLNAKMRSILQSEGSIDKREVIANCFVSGKVFTNHFAVGERVRLTKNDYVRGLSNGDLGNIYDIYTKPDGSHNFKVKLDNGKKVTLNTQDYCDKNGNLFITQAYAVTVYSSQGLTIDGDSFVYYTTGMDKANTYVACSRQKDKSNLFFNSIEFSTNENEPMSENDIRNVANHMDKSQPARIAYEHRNNSKGFYELA